jgi:O-antigen/teichoic acid export membrane protein
MASAFPLGVIQFIDNIYSWIDSILVSVLRSSPELGFYSVAFNLVNVLGALPTFLMQALIPSLVNADEEEISRLLNRAIYVLVCIGAPLATGGILLSRDIVLVIAGQKFLPATTPLAILVITLPVSFIQTALGYTSVATNRYRPLLVVSIGTLLANIGANLFVIPIYGPLGAASVLLGSEALSLVVTYVVFCHLSGVRVNWVSLWRPAVASCAILGLVAARGALWSHENRIVALLIGGSLAAFVYLLVLVAVGGLPEEIRRSRYRD